MHKLFSITDFKIVSDISKKFERQKQKILYDYVQDFLFGKLPLVGHQGLEPQTDRL